MEVFAVGVGSFDQAELLQIAGNDTSRLYEVASFDLLVAAVKEVAEMICSYVDPDPACTTTATTTPTTTPSTTPTTTCSTTTCSFTTFGFSSPNEFWQDNNNWDPPQCTGVTCDLTLGGASVQTRRWRTEEVCGPSSKIKIVSDAGCTLITMSEKEYSRIRLSCVQDEKTCISISTKKYRGTTYTGVTEIGCGSTCS